MLNVFDEASYMSFWLKMKKLEAYNRISRRVSYLITKWFDKEPMHNENI